jgi:thiol-disulfide isomerase/thioredoxin
MIRGKKLTPSDFTIRSDDVFLSNTTPKPGMLLIHAEWCGHCQRFKPAFNEICKAMGDSFPCVSIEHAELSKSPKLAKALKFGGYPTIKFFDQSGRIFQEYSGERSKVAIMSHICKVYHHCATYH